MPPEDGPPPPDGAPESDLAEVLREADRHRASDEIDAAALLYERAARTYSVRGHELKAAALRTTVVTVLARRQPQDVLELRRALDRLAGSLDALGLGAEAAATRDKANRLA
jgi:hypothetical protein